MAQALADRDLRLLQESGFSAKQAEGILSVTKHRTEELVNQSAQKQTAEIEKKVVTREYFEIKFKEMEIKFVNMKAYLVVQGVGIVLASMAVLGWYISHLDNKTRAYVNVRFDEQNKRFDDRFNRIESDLKELKQDFKELRELVQKAIK